MYEVLYVRVGPSENKNMTQFSSFENEVRLGVMTIVFKVFNSRHVHPSFLDKEAKFDHPVRLGQPL